MKIDFEAIQQQAFEKISQLGELLDISDKIARGERTAHKDQMAALKISIDSRIRVLSLWKPSETNLTITSPVRIIYDRLSEDVSRLPVAGSQE